MTPIYTVTVKSQISGYLMQVLYKEGQIVHKGELLAEIDPRPYQVMLEQAQAGLARDQANLENAKVDLKRYQTLAPLKAIPEQQLATQEATGQVRTRESCRRIRRKLIMPNWISSIAISRPRLRAAWACGSSIREITSRRTTLPD